MQKKRPGRAGEAMRESINFGVSYIGPWLLYGEGSMTSCRPRERCGSYLDSSGTTAVV